MSIIYKYTSLTSALKIISSESVLLNEPLKFNDPFDSKVIIKDEDKERCIGLLYNYSLFTFFGDLAKKRNLNLTTLQKKLINQIIKELELHKELIKNSKEYNEIPLLNDIINNFPQFKNEFKEMFEEVKKNFYERSMPGYESINQNARIACFSKRNNSILMWSHYANSHTGVCFEFEENRPFFKEVTYSENKCFVDIYFALSKRIAYEYLNEEIKYTDKDFANAMLAPFYSKSLDWQYEHEVRCVLSDNEAYTNGYYLDSSTLKTFLKMKITNIFIGSRALGDELNELLIKANNRGIPVVFMKEDRNKYLIVPDLERKVPIKQVLPKKLNCIESLYKEIDICMQNEAFISAINAALIIPSILGKLEYSELSEKDSYIKWYNEYIGQYVKEPNKNDRFPYLSGELAYFIKEAIQNNGNTDVIGEYNDFNLTDLKFVVEQPSIFGIYHDTSCVNISASYKRSYLEISIRGFCTKMVEYSKMYLEKHKDEIDNLPIVNIRRLDKEIEDLEEMNAIYRRINLANHN